MPDLLDRIYCSEQIHIPPTFPYIMKLYCKAAIRTQPYDLLRWSAAYFRALAKGEEPPVKERVEYPPYDSPSGLTPGYIKILINQFGKDPETGITAQTLFKKWSDICLDENLLIKLIALLGATTTVNWVKFVGVCAGFISKTLTQTMILICELFTEEPEGGMATVPYALFIDLYIFLAQMNCGPLTEEEQMEQERVMVEPDICEVADKIKKGFYDPGEQGEYLFEEMGELEGEVAGGKATEDESMEEEEELTQKDKVESSLSIPQTGFNAPSTLQEMGEEFEGEANVIPEEKDGEDTEPEEKEEEQKQDDEVGLSEKSSFKESEGYSVKSGVSEEGEAPIGVPSGEMVPQEAVVTRMEEVEEPVEETKPEPERRIKLEDLEDSIRAKIEAKLAEEEESLLEEEGEDREFLDLTSYLLGAASRVQKFTAEALGYRIFKKYLRQEVPGIGPYIETEQVEKVVDFMDYWSHKQEQMIMPRNIRHWMCPPLDKLPTPQP